MTCVDVSRNTRAKGLHDQYRDLDFAVYNPRLRAIRSRLSVTARENYVANAVHIPPSQSIESFYGNRNAQHKVTRCQMPRPDPAGMLERSAKFYAESYTVETAVPEVIITAMYETAFTRTANVNLYKLLYLREPRRWSIINVSIEVPRGSRFERFMQLSNQKFPHQNPRYAFRMPINLLRELTRVLHSLNNIQADSHVHVNIVDTCGSPLLVLNIESTTPCTEPSPVDVSAEAIIVEEFYHMGCPFVDERDVVRLAVIELPGRYSACLRGQHVQEIVSTERPPSPTYLYNIELLHRLKGETGFTRLVGIVVDSCTGYLKSYLLVWPDNEYEPLLHRASNPGLPHSWPHVEKWSRQLLERLHAVHAVGGVVGSLRFPCPPVFVDENDDLYLWYFDTRVVVSPLASPFYPPEFRYLAERWQRNVLVSEESLVTPAYDIYQCGQLLWMLATAFASHGKTALSIKEEFYSWPRVGQTKLRFGPTPLPRLSSSIPSWFQDVVDDCCAETLRPSCNDILKRFPSACNRANLIPKLQRQPSVSREASMRACLIGISLCNICRGRISKLMYSCTICDGGDFDICAKCFARGEHCEDRDHDLVECDVQWHVMPKTTRYHSCPDVFGTRRTIAL